MKKQTLLAITMVTIGSLFFASCEKEQPPTYNTPKNELVELTGDLKSQKLTKDKKYLIKSQTFIDSFNYKGKKIVLRQVHLVPTAKNPKKEVVHLYKYKDGIICGDFNLSCKDAIYKPLLSFFNTSNFCGNGTSLKRDGTVSTNNYDHFFVGKGSQVKETKIYFYDYKWDRNSLSDHLPIILK